MLDTGSQILLNWDLLFYFDNITQNQEFPTNRNIQEEILLFIHTVSDYNNKFNIHNSYTYYIFVKILTRINIDLIKVETLELIRIWLKSSVNDLMLSSEISQNLIKKFINTESNEIEIEKGETILKTLLEVKKSDSNNSTINTNERYEICVDQYWINELFKDTDFINNFSSKFTYSFFEFLKSQIKKTLIVYDNSYLIKAKNGTLKFELKNDLNQIVLNTFYLENVKPADMEFDFLSDTVREKKLVSELTFEIKSKHLLIIEMFTKLESIDIVIKDEDYNLNNLAVEIYTSLFSRNTYESLYDTSKEIFYDAFEILSNILKNILVIRSNNLNQKM
ncbi:MAG: hypothetical protein IPJ45_09135 [Ignavibacteria bacterium]|nr:hypothetical protein [Ignavibacteria bacterium]